MIEITEEFAQQLLAHPKNLVNRVEYRTPLHGRSVGAKEVPAVVRELIGVVAHHDTIANTARAFGVSTSTVAQAKNGNVGVNRHDPELKEKIDKQVGEDEKRVRDIALDRLANLFASVITNENLQTLKPREAISAAKDLATVAERVVERKDGGPKVVFINQVRVKDESEYGAPVILDYKEEKLGS